MILRYILRYRVTDEIGVIGDDGLLQLILRSVNIGVVRIESGCSAINRINVRCETREVSCKIFSTLLH